jgi:O-antigen/teichoic acid export membrane protein
MSSSQGEVDSPTRGMYHLFIGNFSYTFLVAVASIVIARLLGSANYGLYSLTLVVPNYVYTFIQLGFSSSAIYYSARYRTEGSPERAHEFMYSITLFQLILAAGAVVLLLPFSSLLAGRLLERPELSTLIPVALVAVFGHVGYYNVTGGMQGLNRMDRSAGLQVILAVVKLFASVALVVAGYGVFGAVLGNTLGFLVAGFSGLAMVLMLYRRPVPKTFLNDVKMALHYSTPLYLASLVGGLVGPYQNTLLANFVTNQEIGGYTGAANLSTLVSLFVYPITTALLPLFSTLRDDRSKLLEVYRTTVRYSTLVIVPLTSFVLSLATPIAAAVYGRAFAFSGEYLRIISLAFLLVGLGGTAQSSLLSSTLRNRPLMICSVVGSAVTVAMSTVLVGFTGVYGVIIGTIIGQAVTLVVAWPIVTSAAGGNTRFESVWRIYLASFISGASVYPVTFIPLHPVVVTVIGVLAFFALLVPLLVWTKAISPGDVETLDTYFIRIRPVYFVFRMARRYYSVFAGE